MWSRSHDLTKLLGAVIPFITKFQVFPMSRTEIATLQEPEQSADFAKSFI